MKKLLAVGCLLLAFSGWLLANSMESWQVRANEYWGDGVMWAPTLALPQMGEHNLGEGRFFGVIHAWGWYAIYGTAEDCRIVPLWSPVGDARTAPCGMDFNEKATVFRGWMEFRGHPRPFCGTLTGEFPRKCYGE